MNSQEHHIEISFKARYYTHGKYTEKTQNIWFVLHGYGQLAQYFIRKFEVLNPEENFVVAPEGLSRFYLDGFKGRVGATWMTRENRLTDIRNYLNFLNTLYKQIINSGDKSKVNILGFSQGAATACRWITEGDADFNRLILWAGIFPPDLEISIAQKNLSGKDVKVIYGDQDEFLTSEKTEEMLKISKLLNITPEVMSFNGGHHIDSEVLLKLATSY